MNTEMAGLYSGSRICCEADRKLVFTQNLKECVSWNALYWVVFFEV